MSGGTVRRIGGFLLRAFLVVFAATLPIAVGFVRFVHHLPEPTADQSRTDAIVVLTGGGERISSALSLLEEGKADRLFVSGVHRGVGADELLKIDRTAPASLQANAALAARIDVGDTAADTFGNSVESVAWMRANNFRSMRLVTADYHMPRALIEFKMEAPDLAILPNPIRPSRTQNSPWWRGPMFGLLLGEYGKYLIAKWRYVIVHSVT
ncbi:MAG TPA: YdcF family protein [Alphaproteobacteria bacterium]|jgi:uncharacterized SAM-binding protein YcdF (DUF218 family)|nr:YdcF family protein [Alphaproteobacteria bacterium]